MASLKHRRGTWYARVLWHEEDAIRQTGKQIPLRTKSNADLSYLRLIIGCSFRF